MTLKIKSIFQSGIDKFRRNREISSFELVEFGLYCYVIISFYVSIKFVLEKNNHNNNLDSAIYILSFVFLFVILKTYIDMKVVDQEYDGGNSGYRFIDLNEKKSRFFEKFIRLAVVIIVIMTPKFPLGEGDVGLFNKIFQMISYFIHNVLEIPNFLFQRGMVLYGAEGALPSKIMGYPDSSNVHKITEYYSGILLVLGVLYALWDYININAVQNRYKSKTRISPVDYPYWPSEDKSSQGDVFSLLNFIGLTINKKSSDKSNVTQFTQYLSVDGIDESTLLNNSLKNGKLYYLYAIRSPIFRSRMALILFSISSFYCSKYEGNVFLIFIMGGLCGIYVFFSSVNNKILSMTKEIFGLPISYFVRREDR